MIDKQFLRDYLATLANKDIQFGDDDSLLASRILDSLKMAELIVYLEDHYNVTFENDDLNPDNLDTINAIAGFLERKVVS